MTTRKAALITGGSRGIGAAIAERLAADGWDLTISARGLDALNERAQALRAHGGRVEVAVADMTDDAALADLTAAHTAAFGRCDALVVNAGMGAMGAVEDFPVRRLDRLYQVNLRAPFLLMQGMLPTLRDTAGADGAAKVIAISSITGVYPEPNLTAYGSTKAALISMCETFNLEESTRGVSATAICPGYVDTDMSEWTKGEGAIPAEEMITGADVATIAHAVTQLGRYAVLPQAVLSRPGINLHRA
ncbi:SDR family oxidoreductase [Gordonia sp. (in: high G+C Gram-positive bacteria)]|uniref:SDR family NAD(P)-dependent oxidoreductase n=1 Tax=Gordonia sp. (in: high G+C Gram-positive bacteria) TaxID=84139 RepID=UPI0016AB0B58|nr:SDR family oxidoreductase [Gordonia sp. (in: high G+C Gram-positive bacteria)]NLG45437.1 SDR family oxidoreductase [Gordonia sp. (in: high G+C Gram-positive bacteria)]